MALTSIRISSEVDKKLREAASTSGRSRNALIAEAISKFLRQCELEQAESELFKLRTELEVYKKLHAKINTDLVTVSSSV